MLLITNLKKRGSIQIIGILKRNKNYLLLLFAFLSFLFLFGCNDVDRTEPIIHFFTVDTFTINEGDSVILSWEVSEATSVTINPDIGLVDLSGSLLVSPVTTTTYVLTVTNSCGQLFFPTEKVDTVTINVNPAIIK